MTPRLFFVSADEAGLNSLLKGEAGPLNAFPWHGRNPNARVRKGSIGVLAKGLEPSGDLLQPVMLVAPEDEFQRLFGRISRVRSDLSPLTAWCHVVTPDRFDAIDEPARQPDLGGYEAAWVGLVIAHALLLSDLPLAKIKIAACLATETFAIARMKAMWEPAPIGIVIERYDASYQLLRVREPRNANLRTALEPIWACLAAASSGEYVGLANNLRPIVNALRELQESRRRRHEDESTRFALSFPNTPEADVLQKLPQLTPEQRVREFDRVIASLNSSSKNDLGSRHTLAMISAYLATVAAGGEASLSLLEPHARNSPELLAWAYVLGSVGERVVWTSAFDGLGRLVARELMRPLHFDEPPSCDFSIDEAVVVFDGQLPDPLVHLRIKQSRIVSVALAPGVNIQVPLTELQSHGARSTEPAHIREKGNAENGLRSQDLDAITDAVWRRLRVRVEDRLQSIIRDEKRKSSKQQTLPLKGTEDK